MLELSMKEKFYLVLLIELGYRLGGAGRRW